MGILNVTPDSFSDGGQYITADAALTRALEIEREGAAILDIGAQSTRPGHIPVSAAEEWARLFPVLQTLHGKVQIPVSVDTYELFVAEQALRHGAVILNDVSGSLENGFPALAARYGAGLVMMARDCETPAEVRAYFEKALTLAAQSGLDNAQLCLDIGIGFHKSRDTELHILAALPSILEGLPKTAVLCGASRKRVIAHCAGDCPAHERLGGTVALHTAAQLGGANILRAHDVKEAVQAATVIHRLMKIYDNKGDDTHDRLEAF